MQNITNVFPNKIIEDAFLFTDLNTVAARFVDYLTQTYAIAEYKSEMQVLGGKIYSNGAFAGSLDINGVIIDFSGIEEIKQYDVKGAIANAINSKTSLTNIIASYDGYGDQSRLVLTSNNYLVKDKLQGESAFYFQVTNNSVTGSIIGYSFGEGPVTFAGGSTGPLAEVAGGTVDFEFYINGVKILSEEDNFKVEFHDVGDKLITRINSVSESTGAIASIDANYKLSVSSMISGTPLYFNCYRLRTFGEMIGLPRGSVVKVENRPLRDIKYMDLQNSNISEEFSEPYFISADVVDYADYAQRSDDIVEDYAVRKFYGLPNEFAFTYTYNYNNINYTFRFLNRNSGINDVKYILLDGAFAINSNQSKFEGLKYQKYYMKHDVLEDLINNGGNNTSFDILFDDWPQYVDVSKMPYHIYVYGSAIKGVWPILMIGGDTAPVLPLPSEQNDSNNIGVISFPIYVYDKIDFEDNGEGQNLFDNLIKFSDRYPPHAAPDYMKEYLTKARVANIYNGVFLNTRSTNSNRMQKISSGIGTIQFNLSYETNKDIYFKIRVSTSAAYDCWARDLIRYLHTGIY